MINFRLALRMLAKTPFVTAVTVLSLALGIGANAAIFSLLEQLLLRPLAVEQPDRLVNLSAPGPKPGNQQCSQAGSCDDVFSYRMFRDLEKAQAVFTGIAAHHSFGANLGYESKSVSSQGMMVSGFYFPVLGVKPELGRLLSPADDDIIGAHLVVVVSHRYWVSHLGADPQVLNKTLVVNGRSLTIVGVTPAGFDGTVLGQHPDVYAPVSLRSLLNPDFKDFENRRSYWIYLFARLKTGVPIERARAAMTAIYRPILRDVEAPLQKEMSDPTMARFKAKKIEIEDGRRDQSSVRGQARAPLVMLISITGIVLVIACANIANLLLARGAGRATEMAVRLSLGAGRRHLLAQLLTESCLLALLGGVASLLVARWTLSLIVAILPADSSSLLRPGLDPAIVLFAAGLSILTDLLFGLFPALHSTRPDLVTAIRAGALHTSGSRAAGRFRSVLVTGQMALAMTLLILAGVFLKSLVNISRVDLGMRVDHVLTFGISPELNGYDPAKSRELFARAEEELAALPGVTAVSSAAVPVLSGDSWGSGVKAEGFECGPDIDCQSSVNEVGSDYFRTLGVPLLAGRPFTAADAVGAPKVAIVNQAFAKKFNLGRNAVGKRMALRDDPTLDTEIVGLMKDAKYNDVKQAVPPLFFRPYRQDAHLGGIEIYVRTALPVEKEMRAVTAVMARLDPNLPLENMKSLPQVAQDNVALDRLISMLSAAFAGLATLLAAIGLYGVLAYTVAERTREIGVRMALGADAWRVRGLVLRQVGLMTLVGGAIGIGAATVLARLAKSLLFGLGGADPAVIALATLLLGLVAFAAGELPATRAARVEPMQALRHE